MNTYDYYLSQSKSIDYKEWVKIKENSFKDKSERKEWNKKNFDQRNQMWLEEVFLLPLAQNKKQIQDKLREKGEELKNIFYPKFEDFKEFPKNSVLIKISFTLKKPYISKDEGEFHIIGDIINENPIVRDRFTGLPMVKPSTWKGHLRFAAGKVENCPKDTRLDDKEKEKIIKRLFGSEPGENKNQLRGRLHFFPTFFEETPERDVITPLNRETRTPARGLINLEVVKPNSKGEFYLLYIPFPRGEDFNEQDVDKDLDFLASALYEMFYTYGFSAKKTSGFGVINTLNGGNIEVEPSDKKEKFLNLTHQSEQKC